ncbi:unnamed protein product [Tuber aestivum]|uniref:UV radiation resistance-associated gene protein n=1 Tax=Tuber aestivum TaxID=59557 RepID=A0A292Q6V0_9PEZI|nr:unnamed protein product [Tuber aestivum]
MPSDSDGLRIPDADFAPGIESTSRERPLLLSSVHLSSSYPHLIRGRKLRHLTGIALRNLTTSVEKAQSTRPTKSSDDDVLVGAWKSVGKLPVRAEGSTGGGSSGSGGGLIHAKSEMDLTKVDVGVDVDVDVGVDVGLGGRLGRRSTRGNPLGLESSMTRQKRLEDVAAGRMVDVFFSLHVGSGADSGECGRGRMLMERSEDPIYISEVVSKSMNPNFQFFELSHNGPHISRLDKVTVKIWAGTQGQFRLIAEFNVALSALQFIGKNLENFRHPFPTNSVIFFLSDGIYTTLMDMPFSLSALRMDLPIFRRPSSASVHSTASAADNLISTASYDAIMKLNNLGDCIQDAEQTSVRVSNQINTILERESGSMTLLREVSQAQEARKTLQGYLASEKKRLGVAVRKREFLQQSLRMRREAMAAGREAQQTGENYLKEAAVGLARCRKHLGETKKGIEAQRRRIVEDLQTVYPVEPIPNHPLTFTIRSLPLPNTHHEDVDADTVSAALGYVAHVAYLLSFYLGTCLRYPLQPLCSSSFVRDPISVIAGARTFPLWVKGSVYFRFEYAIFLLNKDLEQLMSSQGLWVMDIRHTLPNLKYLLLFVSSSTGNGGSGSGGGGGPGVVMPERARPSSPFIRVLSRQPSEIDSSSAAPTAGNTNALSSSATPPAATVHAVDKGKKALMASELASEAGG